jgi:hypothetical protein
MNTHKKQYTIYDQISSLIDEMIDEAPIECDGIGYTEAWGIPHYDYGTIYKCLDFSDVLLEVQAKFTAAEIAEYREYSPDIEADIQNAIDEWQPDNDPY